MIASWQKIVGLTVGLVAVAVFPAAALGQATRTWVSGVGDDFNPCSRTAPCKTFAGAISKTAAGGEINALDPGGFGAVTITKAITIKAKGELGSVLVSGTDGIVIAAGPTDRVNLYGLEINGIGTGINGVRVTSAGVVRIDKTEIYGFTHTGIDFEPSNSGAKLVVQDTSVSNTSGVNTIGLFASPTGSGDGVVTIRRSTFDDNYNGIFANGPTQTTTVNLSHSSVADNTNVGVYSAGSHATVRLNGNEITGNGTGILAGPSGSLVSFLNNEISGNGSDGNPTGSTALK